MGVEIISNPISGSALLSGEIDHHTAAAMRADIDAAAAAQQPKILRLDFADVKAFFYSCLSSLFLFCDSVHSACIPARRIIL